MCEHKEIDGKQYRYVDDDFQKSARLFRDPKNILQESIAAIDRKEFGPSFTLIQEAAREAAPLFINTARGVSEEILGTIHKMCVFEIL